MEIILLSRFLQRYNIYVIMLKKNVTIKLFPYYCNEPLKVIEIWVPDFKNFSNLIGNVFIVQ